jgi:glutamine amidotransferase/cyclase
LDYGAGNVRSVINAFKLLGQDLHIITSPEEIIKAEKLVFPGVGAFGACMEELDKKGYTQPLKQYISSGKPFFGICIGMQTLFEESEESPGVKGLGIYKGIVKKFDKNFGSVPHMGWNGINIRKPSAVFSPALQNRRVYFVHSYHAIYTPNTDWVLATTNYANTEFLSVIEHDNIFACQFHPEKSGKAGLSVLEAFVKYNKNNPVEIPPLVPFNGKTSLAKRIIACLDVRSNDDGDLVVTKGDQYDVREHAHGEKGQVRNMGKPVELAQRYFNDGADEITFLNITSFRNCPLKDLPILELLKKTSETVYVPLTIGGGIRDLVDPDGQKFSALQVASEYFRSGADKVSIGSDAVDAAELYYKNNKVPTGTSSIEQIAYVYGSQAVVISVDPIRVYVKDPSETKHHTIKTTEKGPNGEEYCWYQCTVKGGRERRDMDVVELVTACEALGAGEILLNCINKDGTNSGYDIPLISDVKKHVHIPVIASSGAGSVNHFKELFEQSPDVEAALAAGIFHRNEVSIQDVRALVASFS